MREHGDEIARRRRLRLRKNRAGVVTPSIRTAGSTRFRLD
jgi:hypothetical protein